MSCQHSYGIRHRQESKEHLLSYIESNQIVRVSTLEREDKLVVICTQEQSKTLEHLPGVYTVFREPLSAIE